MPPAQATGELNLRRDRLSKSPTHFSDFAGAEPRDALIRCIFRTGDIRKVAATIGTANNDGELCNLHEVLSTGETLLHLAVSYKRKDVVLYLLRHGVPVDEPDDFSQTALQVAASEGNFEMVKLLLEHGADPFMRRPTSLLPLSVVQGDCRILTFLMSECGRKMRESGCPGLTLDRHLDRRRNLSWSEPDLQKFVGNTNTCAHVGERVAPRPQPLSELVKARSKTCPASPLPSVEVTYVTGSNSPSPDSSCETIDGDLPSRPSRATSMSSLLRGTGERKSLRMRVDTLVDKTIRRAHSADRVSLKPKKYQNLSKTKNTLAMEPSWSADIPPSLRFSPRVC